MDKKGSRVTDGGTAISAGEEGGGDGCKKPGPTK
jgi:hypothetical protein